MRIAARVECLGGDPHHGESIARRGNRARTNNAAARQPPDKQQTGLRMWLRACYPASFALTNAETLDMSALPASLPLSTPITLPMSDGALAPVAAIASAIAAATSASDSPCGMYVCSSSSS